MTALDVTELLFEDSVLEILAEEIEDGIVAIIDVIEIEVVDAAVGEEDGGKVPEADVCDNAVH